MAYNTFSYGDIDSSTFGITCNRETHYILPEQRKYIKEIPGLDGHIDMGIGGYNARIMTDSIYFDGDYAELRANREKIIAWLYNKKGAAKKLAYGDQPGKYYMAKVYPAINFENTNDRKIGTIQWECNPPWQYQDNIILTPEEISWNTATLKGIQWIKEFSGSGTMRLTNIGTLPVKPIIKLYGKIPSGIKLTYGTAIWQYNSSLLYDGIIIDCINETVTRISDGSNLFGNVSNTNYAYFQFDPGKIEISVTAAGLSAWPDNLTAIVEFTPMNMG